MDEKIENICLHKEGYSVNDNYSLATEFCWSVKASKCLSL